ncbi:MAG TPA: hypothetical protein VGB13_11570 [Candidatus Krumholzibacteria bacterium]
MLREIPPEVAFSWILPEIQVCKGNPSGLQTAPQRVDRTVPCFRIIIGGDCQTKSFGIEKKELEHAESAVI